ncbi:hypothetical protein N7478_012440 [Penicillium angulare]|uniref:uncharacterized protein n=1 Tax=Penicillium angulare TaxID=116970 RepID=UPI00254167E1|nr:uncharacterized protein N7478_012440 [Penicillium angulare]KAJ5259459.1 hypothetical protein N7478_012440 [Penicillium angulare]
MSFHESSCDIHLVAGTKGTFLVATCNNDEGSGLTTDILLDEFLGNKKGCLDWGGEGFSKTARNISLSAEDHRSPILYSELLDSSGNYSLNEIDLATHIANIDGELVYMNA